MQSILGLMKLSIGITAGLLLVLPIGIAYPSPVRPGQDFFETLPTSFQDFSAAPIPPDFFDPGSDPFTGTIFFRGDPIIPGTTADTIVERLEQAKLPGNFPSTDTIPIEIIALSLVSASPITVTYNGGLNPELWDVRVGLSVAAPQRQGFMTITHLNRNGGTFDSTLLVTPLFTFTRVTDGATRVVDLGEFGRHINFEATDVPWTHQVPENILASKRFCASCGPNGERLQTSELAQLAAHNVIPALKLP